MKKNLLTLLSILSIICFSENTLASKSLLLTSGCSVAGTAAASADSICYDDTLTLTLTGYVGAIQWQSFDGIMWNNETGTGFNTDNYAVVPGASTQYRAMVTDVGCPPDSSNIVSVLVGTIPIPSGIDATRCGYGQVSLQGTGSGTLCWYTAPTGGLPVGIGSPFNTTVAATTTFYLEDNASGGTGGSSPVLITEFILDGNDYLEIQNVSSQPVDVTGWTLAINNSYPDINVVNPIVQLLSGIMNPGDIITYTDDAAGTIYWGNNMLWNPGAFPTYTGWGILLDPSNNIKDFVPLNWPDVNIQAMNAIINGVPITIGTNWIGNGVDITLANVPSGVLRQGNSDNNNLSDFGIITSSIGSTNANLILPFTGFGCSSPRIPVTATVTPPPAFTITATPPALCVGMSSVLTASSGNPGYNYTWSPPTGLSGTFGSTVTASPVSSITYTVIADDGTCGNIDSIFISVGAGSVAGTATVTSDTLCLGLSVTLFLVGNTGNIQWQSYNGLAWVNETGPGNNTSQYLVSPTATVLYRAVVTNGGCPYDSSNVLNVEVLNIVDPVTVNDTICGPDIVNLSASGAGALNWFTAPTGGTSIYTGSVYSPFISSTTTYHVEASALGNYNVGPFNNGFGSQAAVTGNDYGLQFDAYSQITIERVYVYPGLNSGSITINLRNSLGGPILNTITAGVVPFSGKTPIYLGFVVPPGNGYRLELATGSVQLNYNTNGAVYPYTISGSPATITGLVNPNFGTGPSYYFFYDWEISEGCKSNRIPVTGVVLTVPPVPTVLVNGNQFTSSSPVNNQWYLNGILIPGATGQVYLATQPGNYTVVVTDPLNGCTSESVPVIYVSVEDIVMVNAGIEVYPNPANENIIIKFSAANIKNINLKITDAVGKTVIEKVIINNTGTIKVDLNTISAGVYTIELKSGNSLSHQIIVKQ